MGEGFARRPEVWEAPRPPRATRKEWDGGKDSEAGSNGHRPLPAKKMPEGAAIEGPPRPHAWGRREAEHAHELECSRRRAPLPWGRGKSKTPRATETAGRGGGGREAGERGRPRELRAASARARGGLDRSPRALAWSRGYRPSPTRLARFLTLSPAAAARRFGGGRGATAVRPPESLGAQSRRLASPVRPPQPPLTPPRFLRGRSGLRLRHSHPAWAALHVSTAKYVRQRAAASVAEPAGSRSMHRCLVRRRQNPIGKCSFVRPEGSSILLPRNYESHRSVRDRAREGLRAGNVCLRVFARGAGHRTYRPLERSWSAPRLLGLGVEHSGHCGFSMARNPFVVWALGLAAILSPHVTGCFPKLRDPASVQPGLPGPASARAVLGLAAYMGEAPSHSNQQALRTPEPSFRPRA